MSFSCQEGSVLQIKAGHQAKSWASKHNTQNLMLRMNFFLKNIGCEIRDSLPLDSLHFEPFAARFILLTACKKMLMVFLKPR